MDQQKQRDMTRSLVAQFGKHEDLVCAKYAEAEKRGEVSRVRNQLQRTPEEYARLLWKDGIAKGWF